jgi:hypothetical protein
VIVVAGTATNVAATNEITAVAMTGGTFAEVVQTNNTTSSGRNAEIWAAPNVASAGTTVTVTFGGTVNSECIALVYSGIIAVTPFDVGASLQAGFEGQPMTSGTGTTAATAAGDEVWVGAAILETRTVTSSSETPTGPPATVEVAEIQHGTAGKLVVWERIFGGSGTETANISATLSADDDHHALIGVFKGSRKTLVIP